MNDSVTPALLVLEDGKTFSGEAFGAKAQAIGEVVFNTSMSGYQEILSDPATAGQMVTFTAPQIGNYGVNALDMESDRLHAAAVIVRSRAIRPSNYRATSSLDEWMAEQSVPGIAGVDTRALTLHIRDNGPMAATIIYSTAPEDVSAAIAQLKANTGYDDSDLSPAVGVSQLSKATFKDSGDTFNPFSVAIEPAAPEAAKAAGGGAKRVAVLDLGVRYSTLKHLHGAGFEVWLLPYNTSADELLQGGWDGLFVSSGPGNPERLQGVVDTLKGLVNKLPMFGLGLGHQLLGLALGGQTYKLPFGHRGANQPVLNEREGRVEISAQSHGYALRFDELPEGVEITHRNLNDQTLEGLRFEKSRLVTLEHYSGDPAGTPPVFSEFRQIMEAR